MTLTQDFADIQAKPQMLPGINFLFGCVERICGRFQSGIIKPLSIVRYCDGKYVMCGSILYSYSSFRIAGGIG